jgi:ADP-ribose pyrophosphatase
MSDQDEYDVINSERVFSGKIISVRLDDVRMGDGTSARREIIDHPGAVVIVALDDDGAVVLVNQYRHAVRARLDELPAVDGESALDGAKRELAEEAHLTADEWHTLLDLHTSPGISTEAIRVYLARGLHDVEDNGFQPEHEELTMTVGREPLTVAVRRALTGSLTNASAVAGLLAAVHGRATGWRDLRPADAPWPAKPGR